MSTDIEPKLLDFMHRLFTIASVDPAALEAFKGCEMVVEIRFADCPKANLQIEAHQDKITVHKGAVKEPTLIMEYVAVQILKHCLEGRESYMVALLINSEILVTLGGNDDVVFFLESMERPLKIAWMTIRKEFPGLPPVKPQPPPADIKNNIDDGLFQPRF